MKNIARLYMLSTAVLAIYAIMQRKTIKDLNETLDRRDDLLNKQNENVKGGNRAIEVVRRWVKDGKITVDMGAEYWSVL